MQPTFPSYKPARNNRTKPLIVLVFLSLLASLFPYSPLTSQAKTQKIIASKPQNQKISKSTNIPVEYKMYYEDAKRHKEIQSLIETNYKKYHAEHPSKDNRIACNSTVKNRLLCVIALEKDASTFANRFVGNLVTYSGIGVIGSTLYLTTGFSEFMTAGLLGAWAGIKIAEFGQSLKKNRKSHMIIYDIRDCNTDPQCPNYRPKNKSTKTPAKTMKKTKS